MSGAAVAIALFGAHLLSGWGARAFEEFLASGMDGRVEISGVDLSWSKRQTIRSVTVVGPDGRQVAQARAEIPSLLDLLGRGGPEWRFQVDVLSLRSSVDGEGIDDLQRIMRVGDQAMLETVLRGMTRWTEGVPSRQVLKVELSVKDWTVDDTASGRGLVSLRDAEASIECRPGEAKLTVDRALVSWPGLREPAPVSAAVTLGVSRDLVYTSGVTLEQLQLSSAGVPLDVARSLGVISRRPRAERAAPRSVQAWYQGHVVDSLMEELESGAEVTVDVGPGPDGEEAVGRFEVDSAGMALSLAVQWKNGRMVPGTRAGGDPFEVLLKRQSGGLARLVRGLLPERFSAQELGGAHDWEVSSRNFSIPFEPRDLLDFRSAMLAAAAEMQLEGDARVRGARAARVRIGVPSDSPQSLDLDHYLTSFVLDGAAGSTVTSSWRDGQARSANMLLEIPGSISPPDGPTSTRTKGRMEISAFDVPLAMLGWQRALPAELMALLPQRLERIRLEDLALPSIGGLAPSGAGGQVKVDINAGGGNRFFGFIEGSTLSLPFASLEASADATMCAALLERLLPWFASVRPASGGKSSLRIEVANYSVDLAAKEFREAGQMNIEIGAMSVRLQPGLVGTHFAVGEEAWVEWGPERVQMELDQGIVRYRQAQIPLGDEVEPVRLSGIYDRRDAVLSVRAVVPANVLVGAQDLGILPAQLTLTGPATALDLAVDRDIIAPLIETIRGGE